MALDSRGSEVITAGSTFDRRYVMDLLLVRNATGTVEHGRNHLGFLPKSRYRGLMSTPPWTTPGLAKPILCPDKLDGTNSEEARKDVKQGNVETDKSSDAAQDAMRGTLAQRRT